MCVCVSVRERERVETQGVDTENTQVEMYIHKGERLNLIQGGRRVLYIVTLSSLTTRHINMGMRKLISYVS